MSTLLMRIKAVTREKVYFIAGPKFGRLEGHIMIIYKTLHRLRSSDDKCRETMLRTLTNMGFKPISANPGLWYRDMGDHFSCLCVHVDTLMVLFN